MHVSNEQVAQKSFTAPRAYSIKEFSRLSNCCVAKVYQLLRDGELRGRKIGRSTVILSEDADAFFASLKPYQSRHAA